MRRVRYYDSAAIGEGVDRALGGNVCTRKGGIGGIACPEDRVSGGRAGDGVHSNALASAVIAIEIKDDAVGPEVIDEGRPVTRTLVVEVSLESR